MAKQILNFAKWQNFVKVTSNFAKYYKTMTYGQFLTLPK